MSKDLIKRNSSASAALRTSEDDRRPGKPEGELRSGDVCPRCNRGRLDYDGLLNLSCPNCGYAVGGGFT